MDGLLDFEIEDTCIMELLTDFIVELVSNGEKILARHLRSKFIQKLEQHKAQVLPDSVTGGLSFSSKSINPHFFRLFAIMD